VEALGLVTDCVIPERLQIRRPNTLPSSAYRAAFRPVVAPLPLSASFGGRSGFKLDIFQEFVVSGTPLLPQGARWHIAMVSYEYRIFDMLNTELMVYHWQPGPAFLGPDHPHIHVSSSISVHIDRLGNHRTVDLDKLHIPTASVGLTSIMQFLVEELDVRPRYRDWQARLLRAESVFGQLEIGN
jgi:hypothetical protein